MEYFYDAPRAEHVNKQIARQLGADHNNPPVRLEHLMMIKITHYGLFFMKFRPHLKCEVEMQLERVSLLTKDERNLRAKGR